MARTRSNSPMAALPSIPSAALEALETSGVVTALFTTSVPASATSDGSHFTNAAAIGWAALEWAASFTSCDTSIARSLSLPPFPPRASASTAQRDFQSRGRFSGMIDQFQLSCVQGAEWIGEGLRGWIIRERVVAKSDLLPAQSSETRSEFLRRKVLDDVAPPTRGERDSVAARKSIRERSVQESDGESDKIADFYEQVHAGTCCRAAFGPGRKLR